MATTAAAAEWHPCCRGTRQTSTERLPALTPMRDFFAHYALLAGILFFVGRLHVFASLLDAFVAGLLATATVAIALLAYDAALRHAADAEASPVRHHATEPSSHHRDA